MKFHKFIGCGENSSNINCDKTGIQNLSGHSLFLKTNLKYSNSKLFKNKWTIIFIAWLYVTAFLSLLKSAVPLKVPYKIFADTRWNRHQIRLKQSKMHLEQQKIELERLKLIWNRPLDNTPFELDTLKSQRVTVSVHIGTIPVKIITI